MWNNLLQEIKSYKNTLLNIVNPKNVVELQNYNEIENDYRSCKKYIFIWLGLYNHFNIYLFISEL